MKKYILIALCFVLINGCKKESTNNNSNPCPTPSFSLGTSSGTASVYINSSGTWGFYEIEYGSNGFSRGSGTTKTISANTDITGLTDGTYDFYIRGNCGGTSWSDWSTAKSCLITGNPANPCSKPTNLDVYTYIPYQLNWQQPGSADFYEVEFGAVGFTAGTGTRSTVNTTYFSVGSFAANTNYDYYVRAYCGSGHYSDWSGPKSFHSLQNINMCLPPTAITTEYYGGSGITFNWDANGESNWETTISTSNAPSSTISTTTTATKSYSGLYSNTNYYFYVRAVCANGNRTAWFGPKVWTY